MLKEELTAAYAEIAKLKEEQHYPPKLINFILPSSNTSSQMQSQQSGELQTIISGNVAAGNYCAEAKRVEQGSRSSGNKKRKCEQPTGMKMNAHFCGHGAGKCSHQKHSCNIN